MIRVSYFVLFEETSCGISIFSILDSFKESRIAATGINYICTLSDFK